MGHGPYGFVVRQRQHAFAAALVLPASPSAVQGMLQDGELIRVVTDVVDQACEQYRADVSARHAYGAGDGKSSLLPREARDQVLPVIDGFGQTGKLRAVAQKIAPHGQYDVDGKGFL